MQGKLRRLASIAGLTTLIVLGGPSMPAFAGSVGHGDPSGDTVDPYIAESSVQKGLPGYYTPSPLTDVLNWSLSGVTLPGGVPGLQARITVAGVLPTPGDITPPSAQPYPGFGGLTLMATFSNTRVENNSIRMLCEGAGAPVYHYMGHYQDGYRLTVEAGFDYSGIWSLTPIFGYYNTNPVQDPIQFRLFDLKSNPNAKDLSDAHLEDGGHTVVVTVPTQFTVPNTTACGPGGLLSYDFGATGDQIVDAGFMSFEDQVVVLPVAVPASITCGPTNGDVCQSDVKAVGGLIYPSDFATDDIGGESYDIGVVAAGSNGYSTFPGPTCPTPVGVAQSATTSRLPNLNPFFSAGSPCEIQNVLGQHFTGTPFGFSQ